MTPNIQHRSSSEIHMSSCLADLRNSENQQRRSEDLYSDIDNETLYAATQGSNDFPFGEVIDTL